MSNKTGIGISAALLLLAGAWQCDALAGSNAPTARDVDQTTVHFGDLNIDQTAGAAVLHWRIRHAAERVCGEPRLTGSHQVSAIWRRCVAQAVDRAVAAVDRPTLTAYHRVHSAPSDQGSTVLAASSQR